MDSRPSKGTKVTIVVAIVLIVGVVGYAAHINGDSLDFSKTEVRVVITGSMDGEPRDYPISTIPLESLVVIHRVDGPGFYSSLKVGDVLTFDYTHPASGENMVVTHRIIGIAEADGVYTYTLKGDSIADDPMNGSVQVVTSDSGDVIGEVVGVSTLLGKLIVFLSTWTGKICLVLIPCAILIVSELRTMIRTIREPDVPEETATPGREDAMTDAHGPVFVHRGELRK